MFHKTRDDLKKNAPQQNNLLTRTGNKAKSLREHNQEASSIVKTNSLVEKNGTRFQVIYNSVIYVKKIILV
jgi:hypothetical protein